MKRESVLIAFILAGIILIGIFIFDNNPLTNDTFCLTDDDCHVYRIDNCCTFIPLNTFNYQTVHKYEILCDAVCPEYESKCAYFRCELIT
ncbi:hypothetical protein KO317_01805 [Candidatus Micrarchaeota archaeon]|jgi:hypothetical protein|nr:hypothetical protein [Candidatus Micrarchaeota archaeon]